MIKIKDRLFHLSTASTSLILRVDENKHLLTEHYGSLIPDSDDYGFIIRKSNFPKGGEVVYERTAPTISLDSQMLEYSVHGKGDFREPALIINKSSGYVLDLLYLRHETRTAFITEPYLPVPRGPDEILVIYLSDEIARIQVALQYGVFSGSDVITKNVVVTNLDDTPVTIDKVMSMQLDIDNREYSLLNLYGSWAAENQVGTVSLTPGIHINDSKTGNSSARHNPFFILKGKDTTYKYGEAYAFNLMYSGNHYEMTELTSFGTLRIQSGINPFMFHYELKPDVSFITPFAVLTYAKSGLNKVSQNMHDFVNDHVISVRQAHKPRPVLLNNWEATYFKFSEPKLLALLKKAKQFGAELLVLDDGWFGRRDDDTKGLGDYDVNKKKLPHGLDGLAKKVNQAGLKFGLWFEPEMVNENSRLFELHPEFAVKTEGRLPSLERNQLVLDLGKTEVQDYIIREVGAVLRSANIEYVKWDMNRQITDFTSDRYNQGEIYHRYMMGLYRVLSELTSSFPDILWEGCASGGNRFDLGMLSYFSQIWTSDNTDAYERLKIQSGIALGYPLSSFTAHVSGSTSHQMLRNISLETRLNVAFFANFGLELDLTEINNADGRALKKGILFYKEYRDVFQYGKFYQLGHINDGRAVWMVTKDDISVIGNFYGLGQILAPANTVEGTGFDDMQIYDIYERPQGHRVKLFGSLINHVSPVHFKEDGMIMNHLDKNITIEELMKSKDNPSFTAPGSALNEGAVKLHNPWTGNGYNELVKVIGDFASQIFVVTKRR